MAHSTCEIPLTRGRIALIDAEDVDLVQRFTWFATPHGRTWRAHTTLCANGKRTTLYMHQLFLIAPPGLVIDHKNRNGLDNRRGNLRLATQQQNSLNVQVCADSTSGYKGVSWKRSHRKWVARIRVDRKLLHLGLFSSAEEAARAYDATVRALYGDYAWLNFPENR